MCTFDVIDQNISFTELISRAGDFNKNADPTKVMIIRSSNNEIETQYIDLTSHGRLGLYIEFQFRY